MKRTTRPLNARTDGRYDVIVVGSGPAGLTGALVLGRSRRRVLLIDHGQGRNHRTRAIHGYLTRPSISPADLQRLARQDLAAYAIDRQHGEVVSVVAGLREFQVNTADGRQFHARKLLLATGVHDELPDIPGAEACYGRSLFHCPHCDAWEVRDKPIAVLTHGKGAAHFTHLIATWSNDVMLFTNGPSGLDAEALRRLQMVGVPVVHTRIRALQHARGMLRAIRLVDGTRCEREALFFNTHFRQRCDLVNTLGCRLYRSGTVITDRKQRTGIYGLYVAGDAAIGTHFVSVASAEGAKAAVAINTELLDEDLAAL